MDLLRISMLDGGVSCHCRTGNEKEFTALAVSLAKTLLEHKMLASVVFDVMLSGKFDEDDIVECPDLDKILFNNDNGITGEEKKGGEL